MASPVKPTVGVGPATVAGGAVTLAAYAVAVVAFIHGARDEQTISALVIGTLSLLTTLGGRYAQAVAAVLTAQESPGAWEKVAENATSVGWEQSPAPSTHINAAVAWTEPRPGVSVTNEVTAPTRQVETPAPFTPDGDPADDGEPDTLSHLSEESFIADPDDKDGADDHPEAKS